MSGTTRVSRYQKGKTRKVKTNLDLLEQEIVSGSGICWTICKSAPHPRKPRQHPTTQFFTWYILELLLLGHTHARTHARTHTHTRIHFTALWTLSGITGWAGTRTLGLYRPWKVMELKCWDFQAWKVLEKGIGPRKPWKSPGILK